MNRKLLLLLLALGIPFHETEAQKGNGQDGPQLVVGIHIDQLQETYLHWFMDGFGDKGFRELLKKGLVYDQVLCPFPNLETAPVTASLVSASAPSAHGVIADRCFDRRQERQFSIVFDARFSGNYTDATCSPAGIRVSVIADELKSASPYSKVFSIGLNPEGPVISGGHHPDGVIWMDDRSGYWCSSTCYDYMPRWIENINDHSLFVQDLDKMVWKPEFPIGHYTYMPHQKTSLAFRYTLANLSNEKVGAFKQTPMANEHLCDLAVQMLGSERLGQDRYPDLLNIHFNAGCMASGVDARDALEMQDMYFRLDREIGRLLEEIDRRVGLDKTLVYLVGTGETRYPADSRISAGDFYPERCTALLNLYLSALYGNGHWVLGTTEDGVYLNTDLMEERDIDPDEFYRKSAQLLSQMEGIGQVFIGEDFIINGSLNDPVCSNGFCKGRSGDLIIRIETGRNILWEKMPSLNHQRRYAQPYTFLAFYGSGIKAEHVHSQISVFDVAPSLCRLLYIRPPTACRGSILPQMGNAF